VVPPKGSFLLTRGVGPLPEMDREEGQSEVFDDKRKENERLK